MAVGGTSGVTPYSLPVTDIAVDVWERVLPPADRNITALSAQHIASITRSFNLVLSTWSNRGINLWRIEEVSIPLVQGEQTYTLDNDVVGMYGVILRSYSMSALFSVPADFSTTADSTTVTVAGMTATPVYGGFIQIATAVSVGGIVLQGYYVVNAVLSASSCTVTAATAAESTVTDGGAVPAYTTTAGSADVVVALDDSNQSVGALFTVAQQTSVGGVILLGQYTVSSVTNVNKFAIQAQYAAGFSETVSEGGNTAQIAVQTISQTNPTDLMLYSLSRDDYMAIPNKLQQGRPNAYWFNRQLTPQVNLWETPDGAGPYQLVFQAFKLIENAVPTMGQVPQMPSRMYEAFAAETAAHVAMKWNEAKWPSLQAYAKDRWEEASAADREIVTINIRPDFSGYFSG